MRTILDFRSLCPQAQEQLRLRAVDAVNNGEKVKDVAKLFKVCRVTVSIWMSIFRRGGKAALKAHPRGTHTKKFILAPWECAWTAKAIREHTPEQMHLPFSLWTRAAVAALIKLEFGKKMSDRTAGRYLARWGFTPQKPIRRAYERKPEDVDSFLHHRYPAIAASAQKHRGAIFFVDESGFQSSNNGGRSYGIRGHTPIIPGSGKRFRCNMATAISSNGIIRTMVFEQNFNADVFIAFLQRMIGTIHKIIYFFADSHSVHISVRVGCWLKKHVDRIRMFLLPGYCPELNPDEMLNNDVKTNDVAKRRPHNIKELVAIVRSALNKRTHNKHRIKSYFHEMHVAYVLRTCILRPN